MFYKDDVLDKDTIKDFFTKHSTEFAIAIYEKVSKVPSEDWNLCLIRDAQSNKEIPSVVTVTNTDRNGRQEMITPKGTVQFEPDYLSHEAHKLEGGTFQTIKETQGSNRFSLERISLNVVIKNYIVDNIALNKAREILNNYYNIASTSVIKDNNGEEFRLDIVENADTTIGGNLVVDKAFVSDKNNKRVGYMLVKYTTPEILKELPPQRDVGNNDYFLNIAGIDFSRIKPEFQRRGLATEMYSKMAEHLNKKGLQFRGSGLQSATAKALWKKLEDTYPDKVVWKVHPANNPSGNKSIFYQTEFLKLEPVKTKKKVKSKIILK